MRSRVWKKIARRWWRLVVAEDSLQTKQQFAADNRVTELTRARTHVVTLIESLVRYAPDGADISFIGTSVVEDTVMNLEFDGDDGSGADALLSRVRLPPEAVAEILSGCWPRYRELLPRLMARVPEGYAFGEPGEIEDQPWPGR